jgi:murein DD-endopeptidase MepM/ murein hydrolase activator NlpD
MISPTGKGIRSDHYGKGHYGAKRGRRAHRGTDYLATPGQDVFAPISGNIVRVAYPYDDKSYSGLVIANQHMAVKLFYLVPSVTSGHHVNKGDVIGFAQDISERYPPPNDKKWMIMEPHIHVEIVSLDPDIFISML